MKYKSQGQVMEVIKANYLEKIPLNISYVKRTDPDLMEFVYSQTPYWGWKQALNDAGLTYKDILMDIKPDLECLICGKTMTQIANHLRFKHQITTVEYRETFGQDVELISEEQRHIRQKISQKREALPHWEPFYSKEYVLDRIYYYYKLGMPMHFRGIMGVESKLIHGSRIYFDRWDDVLTRLGLDPTKIRKLTHVHWSKEFIIEVLQQRAAQGLPLNHKHLREDSEKLFTAIRRQFGDHEKALIAAGLDPREIRLSSFKYTPEEIRQFKRDLINFAELPLLERKEKVIKFRKSHNAHKLSKYRNWKTAAKVVGIPTWKVFPNYSTLQTRKDIVEALKEALDAGLQPEWIKSNCASVARAASREFGSLQEAIAFIQNLNPS